MTKLHCEHTILINENNSCQMRINFSSNFQGKQILAECQVTPPDAQFKRNKPDVAYFGYGSLN